MRKLLLLNFLLPLFCYSSIKIIISSPKELFYEEEEVILSVKFINESKINQEINIQYLQPKEKKWLFVGENFLMDILVNGKKIENFTNHMPPEPKPGSFIISLPAGQSFSFFLPFTYHYYPVQLPATFNLKLKYKDISSNLLSFKIMPSKGHKEKNSIIINGDFIEGEYFPYGWKNQFKEVEWDKKNGIIIFSLNKKQAYGEGMWIYSIFQEINSPGRYYLKIRAKSDGPEIIVFIEGWGIVKNRKRRIERNECFIHPDKEWKDYKFNIVFTNPRVRWFRIKLYSYLKPGKVYFGSVNIYKK